MPSYVYRCHGCPCDDIEVTHSIHTDVVLLCEQCGTELTRTPQAFGMSLKGTGWAGKRVGVGSENTPPARPSELGGTLDTGKRR